MHSVWPFFVAGGTFVLIVPTSELGQGAHTRGLAWKATVEKTTPGRFVIIFVDELGGALGSFDCLDCLACC